MIPLSPITAALERAITEISSTIEPLKEKADELESKSDLTPAEECNLDKLNETIDELEDELDRVDRALSLLDDYQ